MKHDTPILDIVSTLKKHGIPACVNVIYSDRDDKYRSYIQIPYGDMNYLISQLSSIYYISSVENNVIAVETSPGTLYDARIYPHSLDTLMSSLEENYQKDKGIVRGW